MEYLNQFQVLAELVGGASRKGLANRLVPNVIHHEGRHLKRHNRYVRSVGSFALFTVNNCGLLKVFKPINFEVLI